MTDDSAPLFEYAVPPELLKVAIAKSGRAEQLADAALMPGVGEGKPDALLPILRRSGFAPLATMFAAATIAYSVDSGLGVLSPDIERTFHIKDAEMAIVLFVSFAALFGFAVPVALAGDRGSRTKVAALALVSWAIAVPFLGLAPSVLVFALLLVATGPGRAAVNSIHLSYLSDAYPIEGRARIIAIHRACMPLADTLGAAIIGGIAAFAGGRAGWRWAMLVGLLAIPVVAVVWRLKEPVKGGNERAHILGAAGLAAGDDATGGARILFSAAMTRLLRIRTIYYQLIGVATLGIAAVAPGFFLSLLLDRKFHESVGSRGLILAFLGTPAFLSIPIAGLVGDRLYRRDPALPLRLAAVSLAAYGVLLAFAVNMPSLGLLIAFMWLANACTAPLATALFQTVAATAPASMRSLAFALFGLYTVAGAFVGLVILGSVSQAKGPAYALTLVAPVAAVGAVLLVFGSRHVAADITMSIEDVLEEHAESERRRSGGTTKALQVRNLDVAYGTQQVLFGVSFDVEQGEMCALLGTNGAGKSTVLRAIAGLEPPLRGVVRIMGATSTYLEAEQLSVLGVSLLAGGRMAFPSLTVDENLRAGTFGARREVAAHRTIERAYATFPILAERRNQRAGTLSGGEQQMLALGRCLVTRPQLLMIDELTLGLAPKVVEELMAIVRQINAEGTTVILVEQSVNIAASLTDHAIFLERGEVRFDGRTDDLLERDDLLRPVFLTGMA
ncbi:MAG: MFS transporter [Acidimicrobiales bacterium]